MWSIYLPVDTILQTPEPIIHKIISLVEVSANEETTQSRIPLG